MLGLVAALPAEASTFTRQNISVEQVIALKSALLFVSGMGAERASHAAEQLIKSGATHLVSWGTAGSLTAELSPGDLVVPTHIQNAQQQIIHCDTEWRSRLLSVIPENINAHQSTLVQSDSVISSAEEKLQLQQHSNAGAVDMESYAIASVAEKHQCSFLAIRAIVDSHDQSIPNSATRSVDPFGRSLPLKLIIELIKKPGEIKQLIALGQHFQQAKQTLSQVAQSAGASLSLP